MRFKNIASGDQETSTGTMVCPVGTVVHVAVVATAVSMKVFFSP